MNTIYADDHANKTAGLAGGMGTAAVLGQDLNTIPDDKSNNETEASDRDIINDNGRNQPQEPQANPQEQE